MIKRDPKSAEYLGIQCSHEGCEIMAPSATVIRAAHGLARLGWHCNGGTHLCPEHEIFACKFCGAPTLTDPTDQSRPAGTCDHSGEGL